MKDAGKEGGGRREHPRQEGFLLKAFGGPEHRLLIHLKMKVV
jgi:hypothetical protein